jgi:pre-mRNA-processing factor 6
MWFVQNGLKAIQNEADICVAWAQACERFGEDMSEPCERAVAADPGKDWISVAQQTEKEGFPQTARRLLLLVPVGEDWIPGAVTCENRQFVQTATILFERFAKETGRFRELLEFAKRQGKLAEKVAELVDANPTHEGLIREICEVVDPATAISILEKGTGRIPTSVTIAKVLIDSYLGTKQLHKARDFAASVMPVVEQDPALSLTLARINEQFGGDSGYLEGCIRRFPSVPEFWLMLAGSSSEALPVLKNAIAQFPRSAEVHVALIAAAARLGFPRPRIRALLERARQACGHEPLIWLVSAEFEERSKRSAVLEQGKSVVKSGVGLLWARRVELVEGEGRHSAANQAIDTVGNCRELMLVMAICLWKHGAFDQVKATLENICREFANWGDGWAFRVKFEHCQEMDSEESNTILRSLRLTEGFVWTRMRNDPMNFEFDQVELVEEMVQLIGDPMVSDVSIFGDYLKLS